jgi:hypothetical protein
MCPPPPPPLPPEEEGVSSPCRSPSPKEPEVLEEPTVKPSEVVQLEDTGGWDLVECYPLQKQKERFHAAVSLSLTVTQQIHRADCHVISSCVLFIYYFDYLFIPLLIHSQGHPLIAIIFFVITCMGVFTIIYLKQTMSEGYIVLHLFCTYSLSYMLFLMLNVMYFYISAF